jgi:hypothetical protein
MKNNYILGAGPAGLIAAYYLKDYKIIDKNPLGQLNLPFIPGPRLLQASENMKYFVKEIFPKEEMKLEIAVIGFNEEGSVNDKPSKKFKKSYSKKTRGKENSESSYLSEGMTEIQHVEIGNYGEDSYKLLFTRLLEIIEERGQLIKTSVKNIDSRNNIIIFDDKTESEYNHIISTLNLNIIKKLCPSMEDVDFDLSTSKKCFYKTEYAEDLEVYLSEKSHPSLWYDYVYSIDTDWTRQTFFRDYIVYESVEPIKGMEIQNNKIEMKFENLPIQIKKSLNIEEIDGISMLGRFAQWSHKMKANEVLDRVKEWID